MDCPIPTVIYHVYDISWWLPDSSWIKSYSYFYFWLIFLNMWFYLFSIFVVFIYCIFMISSPAFYIGNWISHQPFRKHKAMILIKNPTPKIWVRSCRIGDCFRGESGDDQWLTQQPLEAAEVKETLFSFKDGKAPRPDGFTASFFHQEYKLYNYVWC